MQLSSGNSSRPQFSINHIRCHGMMYLKTTSGHQQWVTSWYVSIFNTTGPGMILPVAPLKPSRKSEFQIQYLGESFQHTHTQWCRQIRRLQSYSKSLPMRPPAGMCEISGPPFTRVFKKYGNSERGLSLKLLRTFRNSRRVRNRPASLSSLEKALLSKHRQSAKQRRVDDVNLVFGDVAKTRAMPVQTVVTKEAARITCASEDGLQIT